jgi:hypothetical protein
MMRTEMTTDKGKPGQAGTGRTRWRFAPWILLLLLAVALGIWAQRFLEQPGDPGMVVLEAEDCDLNAEVCAVSLPAGGAARLGLWPRPAPTLQPLTLELELTARDPSWVEVDLAGVEMFLGHHRARLERVSSGTYRGELILPACTSHSMTWAATVLPEGDPERAEVQFRFVVRR